VRRCARRAAALLRRERGAQRARRLRVGREQLARERAQDPEALVRPQRERVGVGVALLADPERGEALRAGELVEQQPEQVGVEVLGLERAERRPAPRQRARGSRRAGALAGRAPRRVRVPVALGPSSGRRSFAAQRASSSLRDCSS
jgi:hypothetical protein